MLKALGTVKASLGVIKGLQITTIATVARFCPATQKLMGRPIAFWDVFQSRQ